MMMLSPIDVMVTPNKNLRNDSLVIKQDIVWFESYKMYSRCSIEFNISIKMRYMTYYYPNWS